MQVSYDPRYNIAYIKLKEKQEEVETIRLSESVNIDLSPDGSVFGIELLNANEQLGLLTGENITFLNEAEGKKIVLDLS